MALKVACKVVDSGIKRFKGKARSRSKSPPRARRPRRLTRVQRIVLRRELRVARAARVALTKTVRKFRGCLRKPVCRNSMLRSGSFGCALGAYAAWFERATLLEVSNACVVGAIPGVIDGVRRHRRR